MNGLDVF
jgi:phenylalanine-4-hydroxylase